VTTVAQAQKKLCVDAARIANDMVSWNDEKAGSVFGALPGGRTGIRLRIEPAYLASQDEEGKRILRTIAREAMTASMEKNKKLVIGLAIRERMPQVDA
jgi:hypothetical protein